MQHSFGSQIKISSAWNSSPCFHKVIFSGLSHFSLIAVLWLLFLFPFLKFHIHGHGFLIPSFTSSVYRINSLNYSQKLFESYPVSVQWLLFVINKINKINKINVLIHLLLTITTCRRVSWGWGISDRASARRWHWYWWGYWEGIKVGTSTKPLYPGVTLTQPLLPGLWIIVSAPKMVPIYYQYNFLKWILAPNQGIANIIVNIHWLLTIY